MHGRIPLRRRTQDEPALAACLREYFARLGHGELGVAADVRSPVVDMDAAALGRFDDERGGERGAESLVHLAPPVGERLAAAVEVDALHAAGNGAGHDADGVRAAGERGARPGLGRALALVPLPRAKGALPLAVGRQGAEPGGEVAKGGFCRDVHGVESLELATAARSSAPSRAAASARDSQRPGVRTR